MTRRTAALIVVGALAVTACSSGSDDDIAIGAPATSTTSTTTTAPEPTDSTTTGPPTSDAVSDTDDMVEEPGEPAPLPDPDAQLFFRTLWEFTVGSGLGRIEGDVGFAPVLLPPGTYTTDAMYTTVTFDLAEHTRLLVERPTDMVLVDHSAEDLWDVPIMHWIRPHRLVDPDHTSDGPPAWPPSIDGWDFDAWFDAHPGIDVVTSTVDVDGVEASRYDLTFPPDSDAGWACDASVRCVPMVLQYGGPFDLISSDPARVWVIPMGDDAPIVIHAAIGRGDEWGAFGERLDALIESIELGDPAPVDIPDDVWEAGLSSFVPGGTVEFPIMGGVRFDLPDSVFVDQNRDWSLINILGDWNFYPPNVEVAAAPQAFDFTSIDTAEQLADLLVAEVGATRLPDQELLGSPAVVVEMLGVRPGIPVFRHVALPDDAHPDVGVWYTQDYVELWAIDTDAGVLIVTAEAANPDELQVALGLHEQVRNTLELLGATPVGAT